MIYIDNVWKLKFNLKKLKIYFCERRGPVYVSGILSLGHWKNGLIVLFTCQNITIIYSIILKKM